MKLILVNNHSFKDKRGYFKEILLEKKIKKKFPFLVMSFSKKNVIRGLHIQTKNAQGKFISVLKNTLLLDVFLIDERLTSLEAEKAMHQMDIKTGFNKDKIDKIAASIILQEYLDSPHE